MYETRANLLTLDQLKSIFWKYKSMSAFVQSMTLEINQKLGHADACDV